MIYNGSRSDKTQPTVKNLLQGKPLEGHLYLARIPLEDVPEDDEGAAQWLSDLYIKKVCSLFYTSC